MNWLTMNQKSIESDAECILDRKLREVDEINYD